MEAIKDLARVGTLLQGRLLCGDFLEMKFFAVRVRRDPACSVCAGR